MMLNQTLIHKEILVTILLMTFITAKTFPITITKHLSGIHCNTRSLQENFDRPV